MTPDRIRHTSRAAGFTIVELLVVIAIIGVLVGLILPAISGAQKRSRKTAELNTLKHLGHAWMLYGNNNNEAAVPGFLDGPVQQPPVANVSRGWGVTYEYPNKTDIPNNANNLAGPWPWRLLSYVDFAHEVVHGYRDDDEFSMVGVENNPVEAKAIAYEPGFGYNGFYVGGCWRMEDVNGVQTPRYIFNDHCDVLAPQPRVIVATGISNIKRSSELIVFCTSSHFDAVGPQFRPPNDRPGSPLVIPPYLADVHEWDQVGWNVAMQQDGKYVEVLTVPSAPPIPPEAIGVPFGRFTGDPAMVYADGHVDNQTIGSLLDMRHWIESATRYDYRHAPCPPPVP